MPAGVGSLGMLEPSGRRPQPKVEHRHEKHNKNNVLRAIPGRPMSQGILAYHRSVYKEAWAVVSDFEPTGLFDTASFADLSAKLQVAQDFLGFVADEKLSFDAFARAMLATLIRTAPAEAGSIIEIDHRSNQFFFRAALGTNSEKLGDVRFPVSQGIAGHVIETRQPFVVNAAAENEMHLRSIAQAVGIDARNMIAIPILVRGRPFGVLEFINKIGQPGFDSDDVRLYMEFCRMAAQAIDAKLTMNWAMREALAARDGKKAVA